MTRKYRTGLDNHMTKISPDDLGLMVEFKDTLRDEYEANKEEIRRLKEENKKLLTRMSNRYIADMFDISRGHCDRLLRHNRKCR